jgi:hypothetical protein
MQGPSLVLEFFGDPIPEKGSFTYLVRSIFCSTMYVNAPAQPRVSTREPHTNSLDSSIMLTELGVHFHRFQNLRLDNYFKSNLDGQ